jgi:succinate dehydrogenase/fumarate reductase cytochrome b subunit
VGLMDAILIDPLKKHTCNGIYQALWDATIQEWLFYRHEHVSWVMALKCSRNTSIGFSVSQISDVQTNLTGIAYTQRLIMLPL